MTAPKTERYRFLGLTVESFLPFPLAPVSNMPADVWIVEGPVPERVEGARREGVCFQAAPGRLLFQLPGVARYLVEGPERIVVEPATGADPASLALFLCASPLAGLLGLRGDLVLHASAVAAREGALLFMGPSGVGKSTLAACLARRGHRVVADDTAVIRRRPDGSFQLFPLFPHLKVWPDAVRALGLEPEALERVRPTGTRRRVQGAGSPDYEPLPLGGLFSLGEDRVERVSVQRVETETERFELLVANTYQWEQVEGLGLKGANFTLCAELARQLPIRKVTRPEGRFLLRELADLVEAELR